MVAWSSPKRRVAVIGAGLTKFVRRAKESPKELSYYAAKAALESANMEPKDVEAVTLGTAPDAFDGVHMKADYMLDGAGAVGKPFMRNYVGGGTGVFAPIHGYFHVASGLFDTCMVLCEEKMSPCKPTSQAAFNSIFDNFTERQLGPNLVWIFALEMRRYMHRHGIPHEWIAEVSVKNKKNALDHPSAQVAKRITVEDVLKSEVLADPVHLLDISPVSDGAGAVILASEEVAKRYTDEPVWLDGVGWNLDTAYWTNRDLYYPRYVRRAAEMAYRMAGIHNPPKEIDFAEPYDPFDYKELHHMEGLKLCRKGDAARLTHEGVTQRDGALPTCPSGGLLGVGNPIAAAGIMKIAELFWQLRGEAGKRQVPGDPRTAVAQAWGDLMQVGTVVVMRS